MDFTKGSGNPLVDKRYELALQLAEWGDYKASADLLYKSMEMAPDWPPLHFHLGEALRHMSQMDKAATVFQHYLTMDRADRMGATIKLSIIGATLTPPSLPEEYIKSLFNQYAPMFEKCLVENLSYHAPERMAEIIMQAEPNYFKNLLDLGCGTGLAAQQFSDRADRMVGVDLAPGMIEQSRQKNIYAQLHIKDINIYLLECIEKFDLILAADVFIYIGDLADTFTHTSNVMENGGLFCLTTQHLVQGQSWILGHDHRYAHSHDYISDCAMKAGLCLVVSTPVILRIEAGDPVEGRIYLLRKET